MTATALKDTSLGACTSILIVWTDGPDTQARALCGACPRRWSCTRDAVESPGTEGPRAGVVVPDTGRGHAFALGQSRSLTERNGYPVRERAKSA